METRLSLAERRQLAEEAAGLAFRAACGEADAAKQARAIVAQLNADRRLVVGR